MEEPQRERDSDTTAAPAPVSPVPELVTKTEKARPDTNNPYAKERRRFERSSCSVVAKGIFVHQGKASGVKNGEAFPLRVVDIGRGGIRAVTPWPMSIGDVLTIEISPKEGVRLERRARVVRVRRHSPEEWSAGLEFVEEQKAAA